MSISTKRSLAVIKAALHTFINGDFDRNKILTTQYLNKHFIEKCTEQFEFEMLPEKEKKRIREEQKGNVVEEVEEEVLEEVEEEVLEEVLEEVEEEVLEEVEEEDGEDESKENDIRGESFVPESEEKQLYTRAELMNKTVNDIKALYAENKLKFPTGMRKNDLINDFLHKYVRLETTRDEDLKMKHFDEEYTSFMSLTLSDKLKYLKEKGFMAERRTAKALNDAKLSYFKSRYAHLNLEVSHF